VTIDLQGKTALVTGASRGIGRAIAEGYADAGADVALLARNEELLGEVAAAVEGRGRRAVVLVCDVTDRDGVEAAVEEAVAGLGRLDVVVNNAGGNNFMSPFTTMRFSGWEKAQRLNVDSTVHVCQAVGPHLLAQGSGSVINVASVAGLAATPFMSHYGAAKAAVLSLTRSLAVEWAHANVRVNALVPGWVATDLTEFARADGGAAGQALISRVPMQRWATADEMTGPAVFLGSDASSFVTGQALVVDGGLSVT
jgi:NAD(P)-dependent dehydrogenase (short-subunit alcohol dehydrogenase family)